MTVDSRLRMAALMGILGAHSAGIPTLMRGLRLGADKQACASCGSTIPPGRAGRKCESCRTAKPETATNSDASL